MNQSFWDGPVAARQDAEGHLLILLSTRVSEWCSPNAWCELMITNIRRTEVQLDRSRRGSEKRERHRCIDGLSCDGR
jgi:hypothetical protein